MERERGVQTDASSRLLSAVERQGTTSAVGELADEREALLAHLGMIETWDKNARSAERKVSRVVEVSQAPFALLAGMRPDRARDLFDDLDLRVTVIEPPVRKSAFGAGMVTVTPARYRVEGALTDAREVESTSTR